MRVVALLEDTANLDHGCGEATLEDLLRFIHSHRAGGPYADTHVWDVNRLCRTEAASRVGHD